MEITNVPVRLTADPDELRSTPSGKLVISFPVAYNWRTKTEGGFTDVATTYLRATLWEEDGAAAFAELGLRKGALIRVSGRWSKNRWTGNDGQSRVGDNLTVTAVSVSKDTEISRPEESGEPEYGPGVEAEPGGETKSRGKRRAA